MLRTHWFTSAAAAKSYYRAADYFASSPGTWLGKGAEMLGLTGEARAEDFDRLADNLHPQTGEQLTTYSRDGRRVGLDMTFNAVKSVSLAREMAGDGNAGDARIEEAHREAVGYTVGLIEQDMQARVRAGGKNENRTTGNLVAYRVTHRDTRVNGDDAMPDCQLHDHVFIFNATYDAAEHKWKAAEIGQIKSDAPYYEAVYANRVAGNLKELGYGVERKGKAFEVAGVSQELRDKFSRRSKYINEVAGKLGIVKPESKAKLGATTRLGKTKETSDDLRGYYVSRLTEPERRELSSLEGRASREVSAEAAVRYAIGHMFERRSVVDEKRLYETALRYGVGSVTVGEVQAEAKRQGLLVRGREATTKDVLAEERKVIAFARDGRGTCRAMGVSSRGNGIEPSILKVSAHTPVPVSHHPSTLSPGQQAVSTEGLQLERPKLIAAAPQLSPEQAVMVNHVLTSTDRVILTVGDAGTGKTFAVKAAFTRIDRPIEILAPGAEASRGVLRRDGFAAADTVASFLTSRDRQAAVKNGVIWVDEAGQLPMRDLSVLVDVAKAQNARLVFQGDPKQHRAVARDGNMLRVLETHAGLPVARLKDIRRQKGDYKQAVELLRDGDTAEGLKKLDELGWVQTVADNAPLVDAYLAALDARQEVLAVAPTHAKADEVTAAIRAALKAGSIIDEEEHAVETLVPLHWTDAEKGDLERYDGTEVVQFHRNGGTFKAGDRIAISDFKPGQRLGPASTYAVYRTGGVNLAAGDRVRITSNGWTADRKHRLDNGSQYEVAGFEKDGKIRLTNGWFVAPDFRHLTHGYVATSHASQGKTVDRVLIAMGRESLPAVSAEQFYVSVSRGRHRATVFTDVPADELREAVKRADTRKSATELVTPKPPERRQECWLKRRAVAAWESLRLRARAAIPELQKQREYGHAR